MRLVDCFIGSLSYTMQVVEHAELGKEDSYDSVRGHITSQLDSLLGFAMDGGYTKSQYQTALFAVVTFIDEKLIASQWEHKKLWGRNLLQRYYFDTAQGGVEFFEKLDGLNPFNPAERDIREVYYYCLTLGFAGKFYDSGLQSQLESIKYENYKLLADELNDETMLFPGAYSKKKVEGKVHVKKDFTPLIYGGPILVVAFAYFFFKKDLVGLANFLVISI